LIELLKIVRTLKEEGGPTVSMGQGQIAGSVEAGDDPPVRKEEEKIYLRGKRFTQNVDVDQCSAYDSRVEIAVLQERFKAHEQIMEKVDTAIQTLSETNQNICKMLAVHDERITVQAKVDEDICKKVDDIELKIESLYKFRWQIGGVLAVIVFIVPIINPYISKLLTPSPASATIERTK